MTTDKNSWIDEREEHAKEEQSKEYFTIVEGANSFQLLSHFAQLPLVWNGQLYDIAKEGDTGISVKGACWVLQDGVIKYAKLPYTAVKQIRAIQTDKDWDLSEYPIKNVITLKAKGAGTKEVEYNTVISPKETPISEEILNELNEKPTPEEMVAKAKEKAKGGVTDPNVANEANVADYPENDGKEVPF